MMSIQELFSKLHICSAGEEFYNCRTVAGGWRKASKKQRVIFVDVLLGQNAIDKFYNDPSRSYPTFNQAERIQERHVGWPKVRQELKRRFKLSEEFLGEGAR